MQWELLVEFSCNSPTLYLIAHWRALLIVRSFVLEWRVVATTLATEVIQFNVKLISIWKPFLKEEFKNAISKYNDLSASGPDKIS